MTVSHAKINDEIARLCSWNFEELSQLTVILLRSMVRAKDADVLNLSMPKTLSPDGRPLLAVVAEDSAALGLGVLVTGYTELGLQQGMRVAQRGHVIAADGTVRDAEPGELPSDVRLQ